MGLSLDDHGIGIARPGRHHIVAASVDDAPAILGLHGGTAFREGANLPPLGNESPFAILANITPGVALGEGEEIRRLRIGEASTGSGVGGGGKKTGSGGNQA